MVFFYLLFCKILKGIFATLILLGIVIIIVIITGLATSWKFNQNMLYNIRAWAEMCIGMLSYYVSISIKDKTYSECINIILKIVEMIGYVVPVIIGIIPYNLDAFSYAIGVVFIFVAVFITFSEKGNIVKNENVNAVFGYLGTISLPIYLFHPVIISLIDYLKNDFPKYAKHLIVFPSTLILSFLYRVIANLLNKLLEEREKEKAKLEKEKKEAEKEKEKEVVILNEEGQHENQNIENNVSNQINLQPSSDK
jgi:peptidoglycan/LPS O-acetylase OafA/YrhL